MRGQIGIAKLESHMEPDVSNRSQRVEEGDTQDDLIV
jgi:hypothetical protein